MEDYRILTKYPVLYVPYNSTSAANSLRERKAKMMTAKLLMTKTCPEDP